MTPTGTPPTSSLPQEMWSTRPHRYPGRGKLAGVSVGIGVRYGIDPVLVRVAFAVATFFGGAGIPVYLACWLLMPRDGDEVSAAESLLGKGRSTEPRIRSIVLVVALAITGSGLLGGGFGEGFASSGVIGAVLLLGALVLLHRRSPEAPAVTPPPVDDGAPDRSDPPVPPAWDPLGAAPFAWDLPEPSGPPSPRPPRSRHTPVTLGITLLVVGAAIAVRLLTDAAWLTPSRIGALALGVVGIGMVVGAFRRRGWGLLIVTGPLIGFVVISALVSGIPGSAGVGDTTVRVTNAADLQPSYSSGVGDMVLDFTDLSLTHGQTVEVQSGVGDVTVLLPRLLPVRLDCHAGLGDTDCPSDDVGRDSGAPVLTVQVNSGVGDVEVHRG